MYDGEIIDTHMHLWDLKNNYPWLEKNDSVLEYLGGNYDQLKQNFLVPDYIQMTAPYHVTKSVHLEAFGFQGNPVLESEWLQQQANQYGFPHVIIAHADLHDVNVEKILEQHCQYANVHGIRMALNYHYNPLLRMADKSDYMQNVNWRKGFSLLEKYHLSFDLQIYDHQIDDAVSLAKAFPHINIIIEHLAWPLDLSIIGYEKWKERIALIAQCQNVFMKLSGIGWVFKHSKFEIINNYITSAIALFGIERCMFGSNFPADGIFYGFDDLIKTYKKIFSIYTIEEQQKLFYANAEKIYIFD